MKQIHLRIDQIQNHPGGKIYVSIRKFPQGSFITHSSSGWKKKTFSKVWDILIDDNLCSTIELLVENKSFFESRKEFGRLYLSISYIQANSILSDWFPVRSTHTNISPLLMMLRIHKNYDQSPKFSLIPLTLLHQLGPVALEQLIHSQQGPQQTDEPDFPNSVAKSGSTGPETDDNEFLPH